MPTYDYLCRTCGQKFEILHKMSEAAPQIGPDCKKQSCLLERQLSAPAAVVKSANPFTAKNTGFQPSQENSTKSEEQTESTHVCGSGCAFHRH